MPKKVFRAEAKHNDKDYSTSGYADQIDHPVPIHFTDFLPI
jgi:hypothetical protein